MFLESSNFGPPQVNSTSSFCCREIKSLLYMPNPMQDMNLVDLDKAKKKERVGAAEFGAV